MYDREFDLLLALRCEQISIDYTNWKGKRAIRLVKPISIFYDTSIFHEPGFEQYFLKAIDILRGEERDFACKDIHSWEEVQEGSSEWSVQLLSDLDLAQATTGELSRQENTN